MTDSPRELVRLNHHRYANGDFRHPDYAPPEWLVEAVEGAAEARAAWLVEKEAVEDFERELEASKEPLPASATRSDVEAYQMAATKRRATVSERRGHVTQLLAVFDEVVYRSGTPIHPRAVLSAERALAAQDRVVAAWEALESALAEREHLYGMAGLPGRPWWMAPGAGMSAVNPRESSEAMRFRVEKFDTDAVRRVAAGETVPGMAPTERAILSGAILSPGFSSKSASVAL